MCLICIDFQKQRMTIAEARRAYTEMVPQIGHEHAREVREMLDEAEKQEGSSDTVAPRFQAAKGHPGV